MEDWALLEEAEVVGLSNEGRRDEVGVVSDETVVDGRGEAMVDIFLVVSIRGEG